MGLGLALVREVVRIHHGSRSVFGGSKEGFFGPPKMVGLEWFGIPKKLLGWMILGVVFFVLCFLGIFF